MPTKVNRDMIVSQKTRGFVGFNVFNDDRIHGCHYDPKTVRVIKAPDLSPLVYAFLAQTKGTKFTLRDMDVLNG